MWYAILVGCANGLITFTSDLHVLVPNSFDIIICILMHLRTIANTFEFAMLLKVLTTYSNTNLSGTHTQHW